jgi:hypothetical protein
MLRKNTVVAPKGAVCFGCNQTFEGNPVAFQYETDLLPPPEQAELSGLQFHQGHLLHYVKKRGWTVLAEHITAEGTSHF